MAEVWLGQHEVIDQQAAIKVLQTHMSANKTIAKRFLKEAQATVAIKHPGIVAVHDVGFVNHKGKERAYIVMELLEGETLTERLDREGPMPIAQAKRVIKQLAGAMGAAHGKHIYHRDLKPDNLFLVADPEVAGGERIKVLDFGLAKQAAEAGSLITTKGTVFGTPAYMAPEQCLDSGAIDGRADLYSIGCILFRVLCGRTPFVQDEPLQLLKAQMFEQPPAPRSIRPDIPADLDTVLLKLLEKKPEDRIQDCASLLLALGGPTEGVTLVEGGPPATTLVDLGGPDDSSSPEAQTLVNLNQPGGVPVAMPSDMDVTNRVATNRPHAGPTPPPQQPLPLPVPHGAPRHRAAPGETSLSAGSGQIGGHGYLHPRAQTPLPVARKSRKRLYLVLALALLSAALMGAGLFMFKARNDNGADEHKAIAVVDAGAVAMDAGTRSNAVGATVSPADAATRVAEPGLDAAGAAVSATDAGASAKPERPVMSAEDVQARLADARTAFGNKRYKETYNLCKEVMGSRGNSRHPDATRYATMAACKLGKARRARYYYRRTASSSKPSLVSFCRLAGVELVPEKAE